MAVAAALPLMAMATEAHALQPLDAFVSSVKGKGLDVREAQAIADQRDAESQQAWWRLGPTLTARATYTRNQVEAAANFGGSKITITPYDQLDATFTLNVPLVDVGSWQRIGAASALSGAARARAASSVVDAEKIVTRAYYQVIASEATLAAAERALATSMESRTIVAARRASGTASELDVERARADVERQKQIVASASLSRAVSRRSLESLSGLAPSEGASALPEDSLVDEPALASLEPAAASLPSVRAASLEARAAEKTANAAWASALAPTIAGAATERLTNATGFQGQIATWAVSVSATWTLDGASLQAARAQGAARAAASVREQRATQAARDQIHSAWQEVRAGVARVRAARAESEASTRAAALARERYLAGAATQLDVQLADRDAFQAQVSRVQAEADLAYARAAVRLDSGRAR